MAKISKKTSPTLNGQNGRDERGCFATGNKGGPGNPLAKQVNQLRSALLNAVTKEDIIAIAKVMIKKAKRGNTACIKEVFDRTLGKPIEADLLERLENLEELLDEKEKD